MRIKALSGLQPHSIAADSLVVEDDHGNPIMVAVQLTESIICSTVSDPEFHVLLKKLGINKTVHVTDLTQNTSSTGKIWAP